MPRCAHALFAAFLLIATVAWLAPNRDAVSAQQDSSADPKRYIVVLKSQAEDAVVAAGELEDEYDTPVEPEMVFEHALNGFVAELSPDVAAELENDPDVLFVEENREIYAHAQTLPRGIDRIDAEQNSVARIGTGNTVDVDVAVLDSGSGPHPDLNVVGGVDCTSGDAPGFADDFGHGTHVAGIIGAEDNDIGVVGVARGAHLVCQSAQERRKG